MKVVQHTESEWESVEQLLLENGVALAFEARSGTRFELTDANHDRLLFAIEDGEDRPVGAFVVLRRVAPAPGGRHVLLHAARFGSNIPRDAWRVAGEAVSGLACDPRVLRLTVNPFSLDAGVLKGLGEALEGVGFRRSDEVEGYGHTLLVDLEPDEEAIFAGFRRAARRNVRDLDRRPVTLSEIKDPEWIERMHDLSEQTMARTGGRYQSIDWAGRMALSQSDPGLARLIGLFHDEKSGPESLLGFAFGRWHGDHGEYSDSASASDIGVRIAIAYPLVWDLIRWSKAQGGSGFDLGGVTLGSAADSEDRLGGISDFKRFFSQNLAEVRQTWILPPRTLRARVAQTAAQWGPRVRKMLARGTEG